VIFVFPSIILNFVVSELVDGNEEGSSDEAAVESVDEIGECEFYHYFQFKL